MWSNPSLASAATLDTAPRLLFFDCRHGTFGLDSAPARAAGEGYVNTTNIQPVDDQTFTQCMEQLQEGYVLSIAATAGCTVERIDRDTYGLDVLFVRQRGATLEEVSLYAQLKNTTTKVPDPTKPSFGFQFKKRAHFDHLAKERRTIKAVLLVMVTDPVQAQWTAGDHEALSVKRCCYWAHLEGQKSEANAPTVQIPVEQMFTAEALTSLMDSLEESGAL